MTEKGGRQRGFTIIEIILVIFIIGVGIIGVYTAFSFILVLHEDSINRFEATYLSQEGIEIVRNIRDTNWVAQPGTDDVWMGGLATTDKYNPIDCTAGCQMDYTTQSPNYNNPDEQTVPYPVSPYSSADNLYVDSHGFYSYSDTGDAVKTPFTREITITPLNSSPNFATSVTATTSFPEKPNLLHPQGATESVKVQEILYDWY